eukprot:scaffold31025_cov61-Phaeocystis_antarctica.AAC.2
MLTPAQRLAKRAALPEHLRLGVTLAGMRELLKQLPSDAVEQVNAKMEQINAKLVEQGKPTFPKNDVDNGYVNQDFLIRWEKEDKLTVCERLQSRKSPHVGEATVFVSWFLDTPIATLLDALANFLKEKGLRAEDTFFWVCDNVIRQTNVGPDLAFLGDCVSAIGHTVLLLEPWNDPQPLKRAYCIKEVYHTQVSGATFDMVMSTAQQQAFERALVDPWGGFDSIEEGLSRVDVRQADCRNAKDKADILDELEKGVGFDKCNTLVVGLLREALVAQGRAALGRLSAAERTGSALFINLARLLEEMGKLEEAKLLYEEQLQASKETMRVNRETLGDKHPDTLESIHATGWLLQELGELEEARPLLEEALQGQRETLGNRDSDTLFSIFFVANLLREQGKLVEATPLYTEALEGLVLLHGMEHEGTRDMAKALVSNLREVGQQEEAEALADKYGLADN